LEKPILNITGIRLPDIICAICAAIGYGLAFTNVHFDKNTMADW
jgi:site-specific recombinase